MKRVWTCVCGRKNTMTYNQKTGWIAAHTCKCGFGLVAGELLIPITEFLNALIKIGKNKVEKKKKAVV